MLGVEWSLGWILGTKVNSRKDTGKGVIDINHLRYKGLIELGLELCFESGYFVCVVCRDEIGINRRRGRMIGRVHSIIAGGIVMFS